MKKLAKGHVHVSEIDVDGKRTRFERMLESLGMLRKNARSGARRPRTLAQTVERRFHHDVRKTKIQISRNFIHADLEHDEHHHLVRLDNARQLRRSEERR